MMSWNNTGRQDDEQARPLPPYTKVTAIQDFQPQHPHDLPFSRGDRLTILEPCNVIFWYLAEDAHGKRGVIPINFVKVDGTKVWSKPPPPLPPSPSSSYTSSSTGHLVSVTPDQRQRRLSPQTISRSSVHPHVHRTSSAEGLDSSHPITPPKPRLPSPPPMTSSSTPPTNDTTPPVIPPRHAPPMPFRQPAGGRQNIPRSARVTPGGLTPGFRTNGKPPVPLPPSPKPQPRGKKLAPPPLQPKPGAKKLVPQQSNGPSSRHMTSKAAPKKTPSYKKPLTPNVLPLASEQIPQGPPINIDNRPPAPLPLEAFLPGSAGASALPLSPAVGPKGKYNTIQEFISKSGWFQPSVEAVLCRKAVIQIPVFLTMTTGVYLFKHRFRANLQYVGKSHNVYKGLIQMFHRLFERPDSKLNPVELQLKYHSPDSDQWWVLHHTHTHTHTHNNTYIQYT
ncbi:hypothetical protein GBAR_LOCUS3860 [Geodia barretti]|uniref:SH3 domain-containing protein n=1 Tax=Geodia barretti TaxID=519541 RepID=A0AA35W9A7_GEOBA|nr:hypothetical protein GBAR_LOCUS3860 [Geodia barretti]